MSRSSGGKRAENSVAVDPRQLHLPGTDVEVTHVCHNVSHADKLRRGRITRVLPWKQLELPLVK